jgi:hypothetical protein
MLQYRGEGHIPQKPPSQKDFIIRMTEFFDHYLLGKPAPKWLLEGVPSLKMKDHLEERLKKGEKTDWPIPARLRPYSLF